MLPATLALLRERLPVAFTLCTDSRTRLPIVLDEMAAGYAGALRDRVHREQEEGLRRQVAHVVAQDALTLLPNRADGEKRLRRAFSTASSVYLGLCVVDLDGFAAVNDALGHDLGDRLLVEVATRLQQVVAPHLVVRNSGDEFAVLGGKHVADPRAVEFVARRVQEALALPFRGGRAHRGDFGEYRGRCGEPWDGRTCRCPAGRGRGAVVGQGAGKGARRGVRP